MIDSKILFANSLARHTNLKNNALAERIHVNPVLPGYWKSAHSLPRSENLNALCSELGVTPAVLFASEPEEEAMHIGQRIQQDAVLNKIYTDLTAMEPEKVSFMAAAIDKLSVITQNLPADQYDAVLDMLFNPSIVKLAELVTQLSSDDLSTARQFVDINQMMHSDQ